jgi:hypothetical protein
VSAIGGLMQITGPENGKKIFILKPQNIWECFVFVMFAA